MHAEGRRDHRLRGQVCRTDSVELTTIGDDDACVAARVVSITERADGRMLVEVPDESIEFVRPGFGMDRTTESVPVDEGAVGELTDVFPGSARATGSRPPPAATPSG